MVLNCTTYSMYKFSHLSSLLRSLQYLINDERYNQFDLLDHFSCQFWSIKPSGYDSILVETDILVSPGDGLVTVDGYKMIEKWSSASRRCQKHISLSLIGWNYHKNPLRVSYWSLLSYISSSPTWRFHWMIPHGWSIMIVNSTYIYEIINLTCVIDFCVNFDQSKLLGMVIYFTTTSHHPLPDDIFPNTFC